MKDLLKLILIVLIYTVTNENTAGQNLHQGSNDAIVKIRDTRSGTNWSYFQWEFNTAQRDWVLGRNPGGNFVLYREDFGYTWVVESGGNVGIGNSNPYYKLDVNGRINANGMVLGDGNGTRLQGPGGMGLRAAGSGDNHVTISSSGNVGIGTTSPIARLHVNAPASQNGLYIEQSDSWIGHLTGKNYFRGNTIFAETNSDDKIGIGTASPIAKVHITGPASQSGLYVQHTESWIGHVSGQNYFRGNTIFAETNENDKVGIGTASPDAKLTVKGDIHTQEVIVDLEGAVAPDFVFEEDYDLKSLEETDEYIQANKHLPEIPSALEMEENGLELKAMNLKLLQKVEELTLHLIEQNKINKAQEDRIADLERKLESEKGS